MKVDVNSAKQSSSELPPMCTAALNEFKNAVTEEEFIARLAGMTEWDSVIGKTEMIRWVEVLDRMDEILARATTLDGHMRYAADVDPALRNSVFAILKFTNLLFENTSTRGIYSSTDRLLDLLNCDNLSIIISTLQIFQCISKRSHFLKTKMPAAQQEKFIAKLVAISQSWYSKLRVVKMKDVVLDKLKLPTLWPFNYKSSSDSPVRVIGAPRGDESLSALIERHAGGDEELMADEALRTRLRVARNFDTMYGRLEVVMSRMMAVSVLIYSRILNDETQSTLLLPGFIEECGEILKVSSFPDNLAEQVDEMKAEVLRTLTSIAAQEKQPRLQNVIDSLGANSYHGFLAVLARNCVADLRAGKVSVSLCTALFSLLYHISSVDTGGEAIVACGLMPTLLSVVSCTSLPLCHVSFVTRCVRVIDIVTTIDVQGFNQARGMDICIDRLVHEVDECRKDQPFTIDVSLDKDDDTCVNEYVCGSACNRPCNQQRSALIKSLLNFIKRVVQDNQFADTSRHIMEGPLPMALMHIISNADYYTASLFQNAIHLVTNFIYQEPAQLTQLQQMHVPFVILHSLLRKEIPASRDVINNMANTFTALCLNERGLTQLKAYQPFDHVFKIILSLKFITAMKRKRSDMNDVAIGIGSALDDLIRHQPTLRPLMIRSILKVLHNLVDMGTIKDRKIVMSLSRPSKGSAKKKSSGVVVAVGNEGNQDALAMVLGIRSPQREDDSDEEEDAESDTNQEAEAMAGGEQATPDLGIEVDASGPDGVRVLPLGEYLLIFGKILEAMITQNASAEMVEGVVEEGGVELLLQLCQIAPIRLELAHSPLPCTVATIIKFLLQHSRNDQLLRKLMSSLSETLRAVCELSPTEGKAGVLSSLGLPGAAEALSSVANATAVLGSLSKTAQSSTEELRNRVLKAWNEDAGKELLLTFTKVVRIISCELSIYHIIQQASKVSSQTQTEPEPSTPLPMDASPGSSQAVEESIPVATPPPQLDVERDQPVDSVQTEAAPPQTPYWQQAGISAMEKEFWSKNKDVALLLVKTQKNVIDLLVQMGRACLKPIARNPRRYDQTGGSQQPMGKTAKTLAESIFRHFRENIRSAQGSNTPMMNAYATDVLEQVSSVLFDDRRQPHLSLLALFYRSGCHQAFCNMLVHTLAPQFKNSASSGCARSLEVLMVNWMRLADKLANKGNVVNSRNRNVDTSEFPPEKYHRLVQTDLFVAFNQLFSVLSSDGVDLKANVHSAEMSITVYKEVVRNLVALRDEVVPGRTDAASAAELVDATHLQMLVEMGFQRDDVVQALMECSTVADATDYLIANATANVEMGGRPRAPLASEEPRLAAGAAEQACGTDASPTDEQGPSGLAKGTESDPDRVVPLSELSIDFNIEQAISRTCNEMIPLCKRLMDVGSDLVYSTADLVIGVVDSAEEQWRRETLIRAGMCVELCDLCCSLLSAPLCKDAARSLSTRLHFTCLLWEHVASEYIKELEEVPLHEKLVQLVLEIVSQKDNECHFQDKGVLAPLLLWLDLYAKCSNLVRRRAALINIIGEKDLKWSYYQWEERLGVRGKYAAYPPEAAILINKAFIAGKAKANFKMNKKEYTVNFADMTQKSDSGNGGDKQIVSVELPEDIEVDFKTLLKEETRPLWNVGQASQLLSALLGVLRKGKMHHSVAHSVMLLLARMTKEHTVAEEFIKADGLSALLHVRCSSSPTTSGLVTIIVRNCIDDQGMLTQVFERSVRAVAGGSLNPGPTTFNSRSENRWNPARNTQMRDWRSCLYALSPLMCRDVELYERTLERVARLTDGKLTAAPPTSTGPIASATVHSSQASTSNSVLGQNVAASGQANAQTHAIVEHLLKEVLEGDWSTTDESVFGGNQRMVTRATILTVVSELIRGYGCVAAVVADLRSEAHSIVFRLIDSFIGRTADAETHHAMRVFVGTLSSCNHATKAMESLVTEVKAVLAALPHGQHNQEQIISKISELANLVLLMRDSCPNTHHPQRSGPPAPPIPTTNNMVRLLHKRRICNELTRALCLLPLGKKEAVDTINNVLRTLDEITRAINMMVTLHPSTSSSLGASEERSTREATVTVQDVSFSGLPDANHPPPIPYNDEDDQEEFETIDDESEDRDDDLDEDDDGGRADGEDDDGEDSDESDQEEQSDREHEREGEDDGPLPHDPLEPVEADPDDTMNNEDDADELVEDSMSSGEEDGAVADETMGEEEGEPVDREHIPNDVVEEDSEMDEEDDDEEYGRFFDEVDQELGRFNAPELLDAHILVDGRMDDFSIQVGNSSRAQPFQQSTAARNSEHPLLVRPTGFAEPVRTHRELNDHRPHPRYMFLERVTGRQGQLHRAGAVRARIIENANLFNHIFDLTAPPGSRGLFDVRPRHILMDPYTESSERRIAHVSSALERLAEGSRMLEQHSAQFLAIMVNTVVTRKAEAREKLEKEEKENAENERAATAEREKQDRKTPLAELADRNRFDLLARSESTESTGDGQQPAEPMDVTDERQPGDSAVTQPEEVPMEQAPVSSRETQDVAMVSPSLESEEASTQQPMETSVQESMEAAPIEPAEATPPAETVASSDGDEQTNAPVEQPTARSNSASDEIVAESAADTDGVEGSAEAEVQANTGMMRVPEQFRHVLGDIEIPEGVDVEFLAALPDDMRQEVLRDHERQQRAQRASQTAPAQPASAAPAVVVPGVEPVDQEFLAALPPELQEEILAQHERAVREAQAAAAAVTNPPAPQPTSADDAVAVIESLPPTLRAQVLADADDTMLAALPPAVADEARRLRQQMDREQALRFHQRLMIPTRRGFYNGRVPGAHGIPANLVGQQAGAANSANSNAVQILDRDALVVLVSLFFIDNPRVSVGRLHKVIRAVCQHPASCDFLVWAMLALLDKALDATEDADEQAVSGAPSWIDSITLIGSGNSERALRIAKDGATVSVHPLVGVHMSRNVLDALVIIARTFPGHFIPSPLRNSYKPQSAVIEVPLFSKFWQILTQMGHGRQPSLKEIHLNELRFSLLERSPVANLLALLDKPVVRKHAYLQEKLLKTCTSVVQTLPHDTLPRMGLGWNACPMGDQLISLVNLVTDATCTQDGLTDARTLLVECVRAFSASTATVVYNQLYENIEDLGSKLQAQIEDLLKQMDDLKPGATEAAGAPCIEPVAETSSGRRGRVQTNRWDGERVVVEGDASGRALANASTCAELQLPAVRALTDKGGVQQSLLQSLQTLCKIRDTMRQIREQKQKEEEDKKKKEEDERKQKEEEEAKKKAEEQAAQAKEEGEGRDAGGAAASVEAPTSSPASPSPEAPEVPSTSGTSAVSTVRPPHSSLSDVPEIDERLSERLRDMDSVWPLLSACLDRLGKASDAHAVLALQPAAETFFLVHAVHGKPSDHEDPDTKKLIQFAEQHRSVLNQVLRQNPVALSDGGPFAVLTQFPKLLDFDVKRKYFRKQLSSMDTENRTFRREDVPVRVRRAHIFSESYRELFRLRPHEWKHRFYIMFDGEEGQDAGGLLREWYSVITREIFNPNYALFITSPGDRVTYMINKASYINPEHLDYFRFVGRIIAKAVYDNKLLDCYFTRAFYKHILNLPVRYQDLESEDPSFYNSLQFILENPINDLGLDLTFSLEVEEFGVREFRDLKPDGQNVPATDENKDEYVKLVCQMKMTGSIRRQLDAFLSGFYEIIPKNLISMFNEQELELLISGLPEVDIDDLAANTEYRSYTKTTPQIQWFWRALRSFEQEDRAKFLQFVTGTSKVPLQGFASLEGMNGVQKFSIHMDSRSGDRLPTAHTCFNQLDLPQYESYEKLRESLLLAIRECTEGFGFA